VTCHHHVIKCHIETFDTQLYTGNMVLRSTAVCNLSVKQGVLGASLSFWMWALHVGSVMSQRANLPAAQVQSASQPELCIFVKAALVAILDAVAHIGKALLICLVTSCN